MSASRFGAKTVLPDRSARDGAVPLPSLPEISDAIVGLYKHAFGRGPTKARTQFAGPDTVLIVLEDAFTETEKTLLALGETGRVRESRLVIQQALEPRVRSTVEQVLGRRTVAFMTGVDVRHGIAINVCTIVPALSEGRHYPGDRSG